jgi:phage host-nuclease inhibitor protein Gam
MHMLSQMAAQMKGDSANARSMAERVEHGLERNSQVVDKLQRDQELMKRELKRDSVAMREEWKKDSSALKAELKTVTGALQEECRKDNAALKAEVQRENLTLREELATARADWQQRNDQLAANLK